MRAPADVLPRPPGRPVDALLAGGLAAWSLAEMATGATDGPRWVALAAALAMSVPFLWRRRRPLVVAVVVAAAFAAESWLGVDTSTQVSSIAVMAAASYTAGAHASLRPAAAVLVAQLALAVVGTHVATLPGALFAGIVLGAGWTAGRAMRVHRRHSATLAFAVVREQERAEAAALEERSRIARELHDIVAHSVSVMVVQAGAASEVLHADPAGAAQALDSIRTAGRDALEELRRLLGVLRSGNQDSDFAPQPGLDRLPALVEQVTGPTLTVQLHHVGRRPPLPASLELAVYRIVQEGLTNVVKHADATRADVSITYEAHGVDVDVIDDGRGPAARRQDPGHGLSGIGERVAMYGGTLTADRRADGGFHLHARLPVDVSTAATP